MPNIFSQRDEILKKAVELAQEKYPQASPQKHSAFANSVAYFVTGWSGGYGGPSVREHAAARVKLQRISWSFVEAVEELIREEGVIFGPFTDLHRQCAMQEHCFDDDPEDIVKIPALQKKP